MNEEIRHISAYAKKGVAAVLFLFLLIGGTAVVLSVMAAGLNALSGPASFSVTASGVSSTATSSVPAGSNQSSPTSSGQSGWIGGSTATGSGQSSQTAATTGSQVSTSVQGKTTLETPVVEALDRGGVAVGNKVQTAFGDVLGNMLQVLFLEQPVATSRQNAAANSQTSTNGTSAAQP